jgi:hypothetical protein
MYKAIGLLLVLLHSYAFSADVSGEWEGQLLDSKRPIVMYLDFQKPMARLDVRGSQELTLENIQTTGAQIQFTIDIGDDKLEFTGTKISGQITGTLKGPNIPFMLNRLPELPAPQNQTEAWRQDIDAIIDRFLKYDRSYTDAERKEATKILWNLQSALAEKTNEEIIVEISRAVASTQNAHTRLYLLRNRTELRRLPIRVWWMNDGLYVVKSTAQYQDLLSCKVLKIGTHDPTYVREQVGELFAGNEAWTDYKSTYYMTSPEILKGLNLISDMENPEFTFQCGNKIVTKSITPLPLAKKTSPTEAWWDLTPEWKPDQEQWVHSLNNKKLPVYLQNPGQQYWFQLIPTEHALYFQYNRSQNMPEGKSLADFAPSLLNTLNDQSIKKLIVDLRFNTGGDLGIARDLMDNLKKSVIEKKIPVYVVIGRSTFSAGISHAAQWKGNATFVGESCGDGLDTFSEGGNVILPNSKLAVHYANGFHGYSKKEYPEKQPFFLDMNVDNVDPDINVKLSASDYFAGKDPTLDAIFYHKSNQ